MSGERDQVRQAVTDAGRAAAIRRVLWQVLSLNLIVAAAKLTYGALTGAISMVADGIHSLLDSSSNVIGLIGTAVAARPPDHGHPYGHRKFEVIASLGITFLLFLACYEILTRAVARMMTDASPRVDAGSFGIMMGTILINAVVTVYERRQGLTLRSPILTADALHTRSDIFASFAVLAGLTGAALQRPWLDPAAALVVVTLIALAGYRIVSAALDVLADARVYPPEEIAAAALEVPGVIDCHDIRTRGTRDHAHLDFHLTVAPDAPTSESHAIAHRVIDKIQKRFPGIRDITPHVEPPEEDAREGGR